MRIRITFAKQGALRYTGHLDLHHIWERTARRLELPLAYSQGFHPQPKISLASGALFFARPSYCSHRHHHAVGASPPGRARADAARTAAVSSRLSNMCRNAAEKDLVTKLADDITGTISPGAARDAVGRRRRRGPSAPTRRTRCP